MSIPNEADAFHANQAEPDSKDFDIIQAGSANTGVVLGEGSECLVEAQAAPNMTVKVAAGEVLYQGKTVVVAADASVVIEAADGTNPRFDFIMVDTDTGAVVDPTAGAGKGTAAAEPVFPSIPANRVVLAAVYVPAADTTIETNQITDKRVLVRKVPRARVELTAGQSIANATRTALNMGTTTYDNDGIVNLGADTFTCQTAGIYRVTAQILWADNGVGERVLLVRKSGTDMAVSSIPQAVTSAYNLMGQNVSVELSLAVSDVLTIEAWQSSGGALTVENSGSNIFATICKVADVE